MANLTLDQMLVREHKPEPLEGHTVVVLERVGESGERFHSLLEPGAARVKSPFLLSLWGKPTQYVAFAVDASRSRVLTFTEHVHMTERAHEVDLELSLWYRAHDPQLLVATRANDPLGCVRSKVAEAVTEEFADVRWADVFHAPRSAAEAVVEAVLGELSRFARDCGITITKLTLKPKLPPEATRYEKDIHHRVETGRVERVQLDVSHARDVHDIELQNARAALVDERRAREADRDREDAVKRATTEKLAELIRTATNPYELEELHERFGAGSARALGRGEAPLGLGAGAEPTTSRSAEAQDGDEFVNVVADLATLTKRIRLDSDRRRARSALLRLVAAAVDDDEPTPEQAADAAAVREVVQLSRSSLGEVQTRVLQELADSDALRSRLYSYAK